MILLAVAQSLDVGSALAMPSGAELNPFAALLLGFVPAAIAAKWLLVVVTLEASRRLPRSAGRGLLGFGTIAGLVGLASNVAVLRG